MNITDKQKMILLEYVPNAVRLLQESNLYDLEMAIDDEITETGMNDSFELNEIGVKLQLLYDRIYNQNLNN